MNGRMVVGSCSSCGCSCGWRTHRVVDNFVLALVCGVEFASAGSREQRSELNCVSDGPEMPQIQQRQQTRDLPREQREEKGWMIPKRMTGTQRAMTMEMPMQQSEEDLDRDYRTRRAGERKLSNGNLLHQARRSVVRTLVGLSESFWVSAARVNQVPGGCQETDTMRTTTTTKSRPRENVWL